MLIMGLIALVFNAINETFDLVSPEKLAQSPVYQIISNFAGFVFPNLKNILTA
jgi:hypothetical protein